jgi:hypothetical protein
MADAKTVEEEEQERKDNGEPAPPAIESWDDAKQAFSDGVDRFKDSSADQIRDGILKAGNSLFRRFKRFVDED